MKALKFYKTKGFEVHEDAVNRKHEGDIKRRLISINQMIYLEYENFNDKFESNTLHHLKPNISFNDYNNNLQTLYKYTSYPIQKLRKAIQASNPDTISSTCQNCTVDTLNSMDHILPKSKYPEFIVHPRNLIPSCTTCNSIKNNLIAEGDYQPLLNLYIDILPKEQYLFAIISLDEYEELDFIFELRNENCNINEHLFSVLENHFTKLKLLYRMKLKAIELLTAFKNEMKNFSKAFPFDEVIKIQMLSVEENLEAYGDNHWQYILQKSLLESPLFKVHIESLIENEKLIQPSSI